MINDIFKSKPIHEMDFDSKLRNLGKITEGSIRRAVTGKRYQQSGITRAVTCKSGASAPRRVSRSTRDLASVGVRAAPLLATQQSKLLQRVNARWTRA